MHQKQDGTKQNNSIILCNNKLSILIKIVTTIEKLNYFPTHVLISEEYIPLPAGQYSVAGQAGEDGGRHLVAREDIPAGQLLIREDPVFLGPRRGAGRVCVGCCQGHSHQISGPD